MKKIGYKSILLILCFSMFSGALSLGFVRAVVPPANSCYLTETIVVFNQQTANTKTPAIKTITIKNLPIKSVILNLEAYNGDTDYWRAIHFDVDGVGGGILVHRISGGQVRGPGVLYDNPGGHHKSFELDMSDECYFATSVNYEKKYINFIPYFSPGTYIIKSYVTAPASTKYRSWVTISLVVTYKFIPATIDFDPDNLNPKSQGNWVTVYIEFPECDDCSVSDIEINTIRLNGVFEAEDHPTGIGDHDGDGKPDLMVKFDRQALIDSLMPGESVDMIISGELPDGTSFEGKDIIDVLF